MVGQCPACNGVFVIKMEDGNQVDTVRRIIAEAIYHIVLDAKKNREISSVGIGDRIKGVVLATPNIEVLGKIPEFNVRFIAGDLTVEAKNASASNILDNLKDFQAPTDMQTGELNGV